MIDALRDVQKALELGIRKRDIAVMKAARVRVQDLLARIPHVTFVAPPGTDDIEITFDERAVPKESFAKKFSVAAFCRHAINVMSLRTDPPTLRAGLP